MLWYSNALAKFSGRKPALPPWGEELVDQSLATAWYRADWSSVGDDELAYLLPTLQRRRPKMAGDAAEARPGPVSYLTRTLIARAQSTARKVAQVSGDAQSASNVLDHFIASGLLTGVEAHQLSEQADAPGDRASCFDHPELQTRHGRAGVADWLVADLTALAYADRMLRDASDAASGDSKATPLVDWPLALPDVLVATVGTRLNGAYVYPEYDWAHEMLSLAAVLGHLVQGRTVYFSPFLSRALTDILSRQHSTEGDTVAALRTYAGLAGGAAYLTGRAKIISALGIARRVSPRPPVVARNSGNWTWNARLMQRLDERHCWPIPPEA
jgi:hypothetical protein